MKHIITSILLIGACTGALAQEATFFNPPAAAAAEPAAEISALPEAAAAAPAAASAPSAAAAGAEVVRDGYIYKLQHCGGGNGGMGSRFSNIFKNTVLQVSNKTGLGLLGQVAAADAIGSAAGGAVEEAADQDKRQMCVTVAFRDGTDDQETKVPLSVYEQLKLRIKRPVKVTFAGEKPTDFQF